MPYNDVTERGRTMLKDLLVKYRNAHNLSQRDMANMLGISFYYYNRMEKGLMMPGLQARRKIALGFRILPETLIKFLNGELTLDEIFQQIEFARVVY